MCGSFRGREDESDAEHHERMSKLYAASAKALGKQAEKDMGDDDGDDSDADADDEHEDEDESESEDECKQSESNRKISASDLEARRIAVLHTMREAGIPDKAYPLHKIEKLIRMPFDQAKRMIESDARLIEASRQPVPVARLGAGSVRENAGDAFSSAFFQEV